MRRLWALAGGAGFLVAALLTRGGPLDRGRHYGDVAYYAHYAHEMTTGHWPYRDFFDEYPPLAQPLFYVIRVLPGSFESVFRWAMVVCALVTIALLVRNAAGAAVCALAPWLAGPILLNTYDFFPALLTIAALRARRERTAMVLLALGVGAKIYPIVVLPILLLESTRVRAALGWFAGTLLLVHLPFLVMGPGGLRFSYWVQLKRGLEVESTGAALLLATGHRTLRDEPPGSKNVVGGTAHVVAAVSSLLVVAAVLAVAWLYARRRGPQLVAAAAAVCGMVAFNKVFSPQYATWLVGIVPAAGLVATAALVPILVLTHIVFDRFHAGEDLTWWVVPRDALVVALYAWLCRRTSRT